MNTRPASTDPNQRFYAEQAATYFHRTRDLDLGPHYATFQHELPHQARVLDLGCGGGRDARHFASCGHEVIGLDPCTPLIHLAHQQTPNAPEPPNDPAPPNDPEPPNDPGTPVRYVVGAAPRIPFADHTFDAIWACASLLHLTRADMPHAVRACHRVLRPGGRFMVILKAGTGEAVDGPRRFTLWTTDQLASLLAEASFQTITESRQPSRSGTGPNWIQLLVSAR